MKNYLLLSFSFIFFLSCNSEKGLNCFQAEGERIEQEIPVEAFSKIIVEERLQLIVKQGETQKVVLATGENLVNDIEVSVTDGVLTLFNDNGCNLVRDYNISKVYVPTPELTEIRNASGYEVQSDGVLSFDSLTLTSEDVEEEDFYHKDGDFSLELDVNTLNITANGLSNFFISGAAETATIEFLAIFIFFFSLGETLFIPSPRAIEIFLTPFTKFFNSFPDILALWSGPGKFLLSVKCFSIITAPHDTAITGAKSPIV